MERHTLELGERHYMLSKEPHDMFVRTGCLYQKEYQAGFIPDIMWVHTSRYGRNVMRLLMYWFDIFMAAAFIAFLISVVAMPNCKIGTICDDPEFENSIRVDTPGCAVECYELPCANMTCGGSGRHCPTQMDGKCDEPYQCPSGSDQYDCWGVGHNSTLDCPFHDDGVCDEPRRCSIGTDFVDCIHATEVAKKQRLEEAYLRHLEVYEHPHRWFATVAGSSDAACRRVTVVEKCSGCANHPLNSATAHEASLQVCALLFACV